MRKVFIYPYKQGSDSVALLKYELDCVVLRLENSVYRPKEEHLIINWGNTNVPESFNGTVLNRNIITNKAICNTIMGTSGVNIPRFTESYTEAKSWGTDILSRNTLTGSSGRGLLFHPRDSFHERPDSKIYLEYIPKTLEYRVHVFRGEVIHTQVKKHIRDHNIQVDTFKIRNSTNGWVFSSKIDSDLYPEEIPEQAIKAVSALGLDFGAVDIIYNRTKGVYVLEVNTAPGIQSPTLEKYVAVFKKEQQQ